MRIDKEIVADFEFCENNDIDYLVIGENVMKIGEKAFAKSQNLIRVVIEDADQPIKICLDAFKNCKHLVEIDIRRKAIFYKKIKHGRILWQNG